MGDFSIFCKINPTKQLSPIAKLNFMRDLVMNYTYAHAIVMGLLNTHSLVMFAIENEKLLGAGYFRNRSG